MHFMPNYKEYHSTVLRIRSTDVLFADESSMISVHVFEQVEYICRKLREDRYVFGGMQVVFVGDWFQLPPVANILNNDPGRHCFLADVWRDAIKHKVVLTEKDHELIAAVNKLERGFPSESTHRFMESLSRELVPGDKPLTLYGTHLEVDWHNASEISSLPGDVMIYRSTDSGVVRKLKRTTAKKVLSLKVNCTVILLRNPGQGLVNGLQGTVTRLDEDGPTVQFPACSMKLQTVMFSVVDSCNIVEAEREQFPIAPAFALTVHKAQGLTLPRLIINCKNIFNPGQLGVAVGRAVDAAGLQVLNYTRECSKRHQEEVYSFFDEPDLPVKYDDMSCCDEILYMVAPSREAMDVMDFSDESDYDDNDLQRISNMEFEAEAESRNKAAPEVPALSAEARYQDCQVQDILMSFKDDNTVFL
ncbi:ATP-dependent DNA helicase PIF1-like isoform X2 [Haliotis rubra]|uniref:ATP-dependent DNA helicase PIF1-like isoform X2 n=1 Tax=Haliotis rubra TaxID=36100 RepID=UPI001EE531B8|nr:ATP-dependent DNA helicase PIF1-like isoform X2 [Haliotis rubra]